MPRNAPRSIDQYLAQLRSELAGEDAALVQDALYDAEEYLRAEVTANPDKSEADVLELIASTYGAPDEVAAAYRDTEKRMRVALAPPRRKASQSVLGRFLGIFVDSRAYLSLMFMFLSFVTGLFYFVVAVVGLSLSAALSVLVIGIPFFLLFILVCRAISLAEGRLIEAMTGVRMPRRPVHPATGQGFFARIGAMLRDWRTWSTLAYMVLMLPLGIVYFTVAVVGLSTSLVIIAAPIFDVANRFGWLPAWSEHVQFNPEWLWNSLWAMPLLLLIGVVLLTALMHLAKGIGRLHGALAKALLVTGSGTGMTTVAEASAAGHPA